MYKFIQLSSSIGLFLSVFRFILYDLTSRMYNKLVNKYILNG